MFKSASSKILLIASLALCRAAYAGEQSVTTAPPQDRLPKLSPDYTGITIPPNIAPLNFIVQEPGTEHRVTIRGDAGNPIEIRAEAGTVRIPPRDWKRLLRENAGQAINQGMAIYFDCSLKDAKGAVHRFQTATNHVAKEALDSHLVYRLIGPLYNIYSELGIYQRSLEDFTESPILRNSSFNSGCVNCHTFRQNRPEEMLLHIREQSSGNPMLLLRSNEVFKIEQTAGYLAWHPSGWLLAFSSNKLSMFFHTTGETRDVFDANSDLRIYRVDSNTVVTPPAISQPNLLETWPAWSPDGSFLYFCRTSKLARERFRQIRYDLVRVPYDINQDKWGESEVVVSSRDTGLSAAEPVVSPDGRMVLFCLSKYGNFPPYQPSSDLYVFETETRNLRRLEINSDRTDSYHCWSSNGRWLVFSSKRRDGLFSRPHFSYVDARGNFAKPFILPQEDPAFYDSFLKNYNRPELVTGPVKVAESELARAIYKPRRALKPNSDLKTGKSGPSSLEGGRGEPEYQEATRK